MSSLPAALRDLLLLLVLSSSSALDDPALPSALFYPFGVDVGDQVMKQNDDGSSGEIPIGIGFPFFASNNSKLFVNTNGAISFNESVSAYTPTAFPTVNRIIAPYWCDIDTRMNNGQVYYRQSTDARLLERATSDAVNSFSRSGLYAFRAKWIFVATWHNVTYYGGGKTTPTNSFQAVLITDGRHSIAVFNYGRLTWTTGTSSGGDRATGLNGTAAQVGFNAGDQANYFAVPGSRERSILEISDSTNAGLPGRWIFRVESAKIETSNTCGHKGRCEGYQIFNDTTQKCSDIAPAFKCPKLDGPKVVGRVWVEFYCDIPTDEASSDAVYSVTFLFNGELGRNVPTFEVRPPERKATLHERHLNNKLLGKWISCKVYSYWHNKPNRVKSRELSSINRYFAGVEVSPQMVSLHEGDFNPAIVTIRSTIPTTCHSAQDTVCDLAFRLRTSKNVLLLNREDSGCVHRISDDDWKEEERKAYRADRRLELYAKDDLIVSSPRTNYLIIEVDAKTNSKITADGQHTYTSMWKGYEVQGIQVYHHDRPHAVCRATGDPNLTTLDRVFYSVYASGQFTYVQTTHGPPIEIQVRHKPCGQVVSCACGVAAREGDVVLIADRCTDKYVHTVTPNDPQKLPKGVGIKQDASGRSLEIRLPSDVKVIAYITSWGMNLEIYLTPAEFGRTRGLCGTFDRNSKNDLWAKGHLQPTTAEHLTTVVESWRIPDNGSLFEGHVSKLSHGPGSSQNAPRSYCSCTGLGVGDCGSSKHDTNDLDPNNVDHVKNSLKRMKKFVDNTIDQQLRRRRSAADPGLDHHLLSDDIDLRYDGSAYYELVPKTFGNVSRVNESALTEAEAEAHCRRVLWEELPVRQYCKGKVNQSDVDGIINKCVSDIQMTGDTSWANDKIQEIEGLCMFELITANITETHRSVDDLKTVVRDMSDHICLPPNCSDHGVCQLGKCACHKGYVGADCSLSKDAVPRITGLLSQSSACDVDTSVCKKVEFLAEGVAALPTLTCKIDVTKLDNSTQVLHTNGTFESMGIASCQLPTDTFQAGLRTLQRIEHNVTSSASENYDLGFYSLPPGNPVLLYSVSISNNGRAYSNPIHASIYESKCFDSNGVRKIDTCLIGNYCFKENDTNPFNPECDSCDPTFSQGAWKKKPDPSCDPCRSFPCSGKGACISPFKGIYRCTNHSESRGFVLLAVGLSIVSVVLLVFAIIIIVHCRNKKDSKGRFSATDVGMTID